TQSPTPGLPADADTSADAVTPDGRYVVFSSAATNIDPTFTAISNRQVYVRDRTLGTTDVVSKGFGDVAADGDASGGAISDDGRFVGFTPTATGLAPGDGSGQADVYVRDRAAGTTELASLLTGGVPSNTDVYAGGLSGDGRYVMMDAGNFFDPLWPGGVGGGF